MSSVAPTALSPPAALTIDRFDEKQELIVAQSTSQCCRTGCCQPTINWVLNEADNFSPGGNPLDLPSSGWIHEESTYFMRCWSGCCPGCRETKYVQHSTTIPEAVTHKEGGNWCTCQKSLVTPGLSEAQRGEGVVAIHEKKQTCGANCCACCGPAPYLETKDAQGKTLGQTVFVCDACCFVPKFDILDASGQKKFRLRPDTCVAGLCVKCTCGGPKGKCCRVPFLVRDPTTLQPLPGKSNGEKAQVTQLWTGLVNECCTQRDVYHVVFPDQATTAEKLTLIGSSILLDICFVEQNQDSNNN